jgi:enoyl-[acyl-carrier protein] reductase I
MVTMQNLFHDGGYSTTGVSNEVMQKVRGYRINGE